MPNISAVVITKNEEQNIERCINSLADIADEILVVDSGSEDRTVLIAEKLGASVIITDWFGYSQTKNLGNATAKHPYILSIDADEAVSEDLKKALLMIKPNLKPNKAYSFNRLTNYCGNWIRHCGWYPDKKLRLWHKDFGEWTGLIHETIELDKVVKEIHIDGDLLHYSYYTKEDHYRQVEKFTSMTAKDAYSKGKQSNYLKMAIAPLVKFLKAYFFQLGFLDGAAGFQVCRISAYATYLKYKKLKRLQLGHEL